MSPRNYALEGRIREKCIDNGVRESALDDFITDHQAYKFTTEAELPAWIEQMRKEKPYRFVGNADDAEQQLYADAFGPSPNYSKQGYIVKQVGEERARQIAAEFQTTLGGKGGIVPANIKTAAVVDADPKLAPTLTTRCRGSLRPFYLVSVSDVPTGRNPIRLGDTNEIAVGADVHAIGHPTGEAWTYTTGVISQYRQAYEWQAGEEDIKHKADIIQTQTPINPGNSGGPLIGDSGDLIGVNSFKATGEGLNFAVSVDDVKRFLARQGNRIAQNRNNQQKVDCKPKEVSKFRDKGNTAAIVSYDMFCDGKDTGEYVTPDKQTEAIFLRVDRNEDGKADVIFFDLKRRGRWDISLWDENYTGQWTLVGYHDDGSLTPSRFESYAAFQKRLASNR